MTAIIRIAKRGGLSWTSSSTMLGKQYFPLCLEYLQLVILWRRSTRKESHARKLWTRFVVEITVLSSGHLDKLQWAFERPMKIFRWASLTNLAWTVHDDMLLTSRYNYNVTPGPVFQLSVWEKVIETHLPLITDS